MLIYWINIQNGLNQLELLKKWESGFAHSIGKSWHFRPSTVCATENIASTKGTRAELGLSRHHMLVGKNATFGRACETRFQFLHTTTSNLTSLR